MKNSINTTTNNQPQNKNTTTETKITNTVRTKWDRSKIVAPSGGELRTKQSFKDECDVNNIMAKYRKTGVLPSLIRANPVYGDFANPVDFQEAHNLIILANEQFAALPALARERFNNDPAKFLEFCTNKANKEEMGRMGLLKEVPKAPEKTPEPKGEEKK